jgi:threonine aldolase
MLAGSRDLISQAVRYRRMLGGAMRQIGILAAAGSYALAHNVHRLAEDHINARTLADRLAESGAIGIDPTRVETNIVVFTVSDATGLVAACREREVLLNAFTSTLVRAVTHLDVTREHCEAAASVIVAAAEGR